MKWYVINNDDFVRVADPVYFLIDVFDWSFDNAIDTIALFKNIPKRIMVGVDQNNHNSVWLCNEKWIHNKKRRIRKDNRRNG